MRSKTIDLTVLSPLLERYNGRSREALLPLLHEAQALYGWLPRQVQEAIGETLRVPLADIHGVVQFYTLFYDQPTAKKIIRLCEDPACSLNGAQELAAAMSRRLGLAPGQTSADESITFELVPCLGMCAHAPCGLNGRSPGGDLGPDAIDRFLADALPDPGAKIYGRSLHILKRIGLVDPTSLDDYQANGGYLALPKALALTPDDLINEVESFGILGRGGAMFPLGRKWRFTRGAPGQPSDKHIVVNADESEPGTFKDRGLMEEDPFSLIEAATIAAYAVGAENGWIFIRGEYPRVYERLSHAVNVAREQGLLGKNILGHSGFHFDIEIRLGAGAYICGEETALFEAIEGKRGFPRIKPPFPTTHGLFGQPTAANNVETLLAMLAALNLGSDAWRALGTADSPGTKLFCLSGHVRHPGVYEVPFGLTIGELIKMAGGVPNGRSLKAILLGGAAGVFIGPEQLDVRLTYEDMRAANLPIGSGVLMLFDETAVLPQHLYELGRFFAHESCGKCFPCQLGTQRQMEILDRMAHNGGPQPHDRVDLQDIGFAMTHTSLCGLGQTAASAVLSALTRWPELAEKG